MTTGADLVATAVRITSSRRRVYVLGAHPATSDPDPPQFDCSSFVGWVCGQFGIAVGFFPPYTVTQWNACKQAGTTISVEAAVRTPGALLFNHRRPDGTPVDPPPGLVPADFHAHVAFSRGDGSTVEAMNPAAGCGIGNAQPAGVRWTAGALVPGVSYGAATASGPGTSSSTPGPVPTFPGDAFPGAGHDVVVGWQVGMIACDVLADTVQNHDGDFGDGMTTKINELQTSFGWSAPDGRAGAHTWSHMYTRRRLPCPRCGR